MSAMYIPTNKKTGKRYSAITEDEKKAYEADNSAAKGKYTFQLVEDKAPKAPMPFEAKAVHKEEK